MSEFARQFGIPEIPESPSTDKLTGEYFRSLSELSQGLTLNVVGEIPPHTIFHNGVTIDGVIVFIDIGSYSNRSMKLTNDQTLYWINRFFKHLSPLLERFQATIDKTIGDCLMLVLSPKLGCKAPLRSAVEMALEIIRFDVWGYYPHIGIAEGRLLLGYAGPPHAMSLSVYGETVNIASRLCIVDQLSIGITMKSWMDVMNDIKLDEENFEVLNGNKPLKSFNDIEYKIIHAKSRFYPQCQLPPLTIGKIVMRGEGDSNA